MSIRTQFTALLKMLQVAEPEPVPAELDFVEIEQPFYEGDIVSMEDRTGRHIAKVLEVDGDWVYVNVRFSNTCVLPMWVMESCLTLMSAA